MSAAAVAAARNTRTDPVTTELAEQISAIGDALVAVHGPARVAWAMLLVALAAGIDLQGPELTDFASGILEGFDLLVTGRGDARQPMGRA